MALSRTALNTKGEKLAAKIAWPQHDKTIDFIPAEFTMQKHGWGNARHYDIRIQKKTASTWFGFEFFSEPWLVTTLRHAMGGAKGYSQLIVPKHTGLPRKESLGEIRWMDFAGKMKPGQIGNPTKNYTAYMELLEHRQPAVLHRRQLDNVLITFLGKKLKGTYLIRLIPVTGGVSWTLVKLAPEHQLNPAKMLTVAEQKTRIPMMKGWDDPRLKEMGLI